MFGNFIEVLKPEEGMGGLYLSNLRDAGNKLKLDAYKIKAILCIMKIQLNEYKPYQYFGFNHKEIFKAEKILNQMKNS